MKRTLVRDALAGKQCGAEIVVAGWVKTRRDSKAGLSFIEINDGSSFANLQVLAPNTLGNYTDEIVRLHPGASIKATGVLRESPASGQAYELDASEIQVLGFCDPVEYPLAARDAFPSTGCAKSRICVQGRTRSAP